MPQGDKILFVEDDPNIIDVLEIHLKDLGYQVDRAGDGEMGLNKAQSNQYALVILDLMLPKLGGLEVCQKIRARNKTLPILMLTARNEEMDKVLGLEFGADDYITKPFSIREFIARVKAILRRVEVDRDKDSTEESNGPVSYGPLTIDLIKRRVSLDGKNIELTAKEFDLLVLFAKNPGRVYNRQQLLDIVWGYQYSGYDHTVNSHINRLRNKIEKDPTNPKFIKTLWGVGYRFSDIEEIDS
jgi:two-component system, OmpR family, alkaline phosphatase synthesis response regulator PhoP